MVPESMLFEKVTGVLYERGLKGSLQSYKTAHADGTPGGGGGGGSLEIPAAQTLQ